MKKNTGKIIQVIGAVVDVQFDPESIPPIYNALTTDSENTDSKKLVLEVSTQMGEGRVRTIALGSTDGIKRNQEVIDTGAPISVPVGRQTLGRIFNVVGAPIDGKGKVNTQKTLPIHRDAPKFTSQAVEAQILETGLKVIDLIEEPVLAKQF